MEPFRPHLSDGLGYPSKWACCDMYSVQVQKHRRLFQNIDLPQQLLIFVKETLSAKLPTIHLLLVNHK